MRLNKLLLTLLYLTLMLPKLLLAETLEKVIADSNLYTVKIDISTEMPFIEDSWYGSGTGFLVDKEIGLILTNKHVSSQSPSLIDVNFKGEDYLEGTWNKISEKHWRYLIPIFQQP